MRIVQPILKATTTAVVATVALKVAKEAGALTDKALDRIEAVIV